MKGKRRWLLVPLVILALLLSAIPVYAIPPIPHAFYGTLTIGGSPAPVGTVVTAKVGGVQYSSITTTVEGQYGSSDPLGDRLLVAPGEGDIATGDTIYFYANGSVANQTYAFSPGVVTELNLTTGDADTTPPTVVSKSPVADATGIAVNTTVSVTFSEAMDSSTITTSSFTLDSVSGSVSYDSGTYTATFTPSANLADTTTYTATLSTAITDAAGNPLASAYSWSFTTVPTVTPGDANGDGAVNALDITKVERIIAGLDAETPGADANQDGNINALDITKTERIIAGLD
jgi:hypothetical protein